MRRRNLLKIGFSLPLLGMTSGSVFAKESQPESGQELTFRILANAAKELKKCKHNFGGYFAKVAKLFLGIPYVAHSLEHPGPEKCTILFGGLDCVTFYETALALARICYASDDADFDDLIAELTKIRYRDGKIVDYSSRLHYTSEWISDNSRKKIVKDVSRETGGQSLVPNVSFMSQSPKYYEKLKNDPAMVRKIEENENKINARKRYYIAKNRFKEEQQNLRSGDIIGFVTVIGGLDYSHTGIISEIGNQISFLHASSKSGKVVVAPSLIDYLSKSSKTLGISVARPIEPM